MWQDYMITAIQFGLSLALLPMVFGRDKPDEMTSLSNAVLLYVLGWVVFTLDLYVSSVSAVLVASVWALLFYQKRFGE